MLVFYHFLPFLHLLEHHLHFFFYILLIESLTFSPPNSILIFNKTSLSLPDLESIEYDTDRSMRIISKLELTDITEDDYSPSKFEYQGDKTQDIQDDYEHS